MMLLTLLLMAFGRVKKNNNYIIKISNLLRDNKLYFKRKFEINLLSLTLFIGLTSCGHNKIKNLSSVVYTEYGSSAFSNVDNQAYLDLIDKTRLKTVSVLFTCHTQDKYSDKIDCHSENSPKLKRIVELLKTQKDNNFKTTLRIYVDLLSGDWRALWEPKNKKQAFVNLENAIIETISQFPPNTIDLLIIGAEYEKLTLPKYYVNWQKLIANVRKVYSGLLTYGANTNLSDQNIPEVHWVPFWKELDYVGLDYYYPVSKPSHNLEAHNDYLKKLTEPIKSINNKIFINEVGVPLAANGYLKPYEWKWQNEHESPLSQSLYLSDFIKAAHNNLIYDIQIWRFMPREKKVFPFGYIIDHQQTMKSIKALSH
jgi:hypothetical protein